MQSMIDRLPQVIAGVTFFVLALAITHEFAYFAVVGPQFQSLMTATDYLGSALSWMPLLAVLLFFTSLGFLAFVRWSGGRSPQQLRSESKGYRRVSGVMDTIFGAAGTGGMAASVFLFGNWYELGFAQGLASVSLASFLLWLRQFELFERVITLPVYLFAAGVPVLMLNAFVTGRSDGYRALTNQEHVHNVKLKDAADETKMSVLRLLSDGVLARKLDDRKVVFFRWDRVEALTLDFEPPDSKSLVCRKLNYGCRNASVSPVEPAAPAAPAAATPSK
jgi:hypothetical protein